MAPNPIVLNKAKALFPHLDFGFLPWFVGAIVPAAVCAVGLPLILRWACGLGGDNQMQDHKSSSSKNDSSVVKHAQTELDQMGSVTSKEWVSNNNYCLYVLHHAYHYTKQLCLVLLLCLGLWVTSSYTKLDATLVALLGIVALLLLGTITWKDVASNTNAASIIVYSRIRGGGGMHFTHANVPLIVGHAFLVGWVCYNRTTAFRSRCICLSWS